LPRPFVAGALACTLLAGGAAAQAVDRGEIEDVVRELLTREPELVIDAIRQYQAEQEAARDAQIVGAIDAYRDELTSAAHPSVGPPDAAVTLIEFFDYRCGFCRRMVPRIDALLADHADIRIVFVEFPVLGPDSLRAAQASLAVWRQAPDVYMDFHRAVMAASDLSAPALVELAEVHGVDGDALVTEMQSEAVRAQLTENHRIAQAIGIEGTPAFVVGDAFMPGAVPLEQLEQAIAAARG